LAGVHGVGYKIGLTSLAMQAMCGIDTPISGVILSDGVLQSPAETSGSRFGRLGLE
jgi:2-keto-4-pentenoate hydratase